MVSVTSLLKLYHSQGGHRVDGWISMEIGCYCLNKKKKNTKKVFAPVCLIEYLGNYGEISSRIIKKASCGRCTEQSHSLLIN